MTIRLSIAAGGFASLLSVTFSSAQPAGDPQPILINRPAPNMPRQLEFKSVGDENNGSIQLVNGDTKVDAAAWRAVVVARISGGGYCTAAVIGPRVLLTAAHCIDAGFGPKTAVIGGRVVIGTPFQLKGCEMHPAYAAADRVALDVPRMSDDYALCELDGAPALIYETLAEGPTVGPGSQVLMTGYGCFGIAVVAGSLASTAADPADKEKLRLGDATLEAVGVKDHKSDPGSYMRVRSRNHEPILCPGDSGGPAIIGASLSQQSGPLRRIAGVNSMVTAMPRQAGYDYLSFMASTSTASFKSFAASWQSKSPSTRQICGRDLSPGVSNCRA